MTQHDQDAIVGRVVREHSAGLTKLAALVAEGNRVGQVLDRLGKALQLPEAQALVRHSETTLAMLASENTDWAQLTRDRISDLVTEVKTTTEVVLGPSAA
jgi:hypothetical protein